MSDYLSLDVTPCRNVENQLCLTNRTLEAAMTKPGFHRKMRELLSGAQDTYWGALLTLMAVEPGREELQPVHAELRRLRSTLTAFKH